METQLTVYRFCFEILSTNQLRTVELNENKKEKQMKFPSWIFLQIRALKNGNFEGLKNIPMNIKFGSNKV